MKTKHYFAAACVLSCFAGTAQAQEVTLYGMIDTGIEWTNKVPQGPAGSDAGTSSITRFPIATGGIAPSRWGLKGSEDLGDGYRAFFQLESGFSPGDGKSAQAGRLFGRTAILGISGPYGTIQLGRQYTPTTLYLMSPADVMGPSVHGLGNFDPYIPNARADNAIGYSNKIDNFTFGGTYSFGRDNATGGPSGTTCGGSATNNNGSCKEKGVYVKYNAANYGFGAAFDRVTGGPNESFWGLGSLHAHDDRFGINGYYTFTGDITLSGGWMQRRHTPDTDATPGEIKFTTNTFFVGLSYPIGRFVINTQLVRMISNADSETEMAVSRRRGNGEATALYLRGIYNFSKRTSGYITTGHMRNQKNSAVSVTPGIGVAAWGGAAVGSNQTGVMIGLNHRF